MDIEYIKHYCCGCGFCNQWEKGNFDKRGFFRPNEGLITSNFDTDACYCNSLTGSQKHSEPWGPVLSTFYSWSSDETVRIDASSGGTLTALACYLLEQKIVDGVIQARTDPHDPTKTIMQVSHTKKDVYRCMGSRYTASASLLNILSVVEDESKYAVIAKPCDCRVLRTWISKNPKWKAVFPFLLSFFCGGTPTVQANDRLLSKMNVSRDQLKDFWYRGHGWPGKTTAIMLDGEKSEVDYETSWGKILGRDLQEICRFCWEGTGEAADISCGDGWYLKNGGPSFEEGFGRNITFARTPAGVSLINMANRDGAIRIESVEDVACLDEMQPGQFMRKAAMFSFIAAMKLTGKRTPSYSLMSLWHWSKKLAITKRLKMFFGTLKRIASGRIG